MNPFPDGEPGDRLLVTVLASRTLPLIRYELTDRLRLSTRPCPCELPFRLVEAVEGRTDDLLTLPAQAGGLVHVHPVIFHQTLDLLDAVGWQVRHHEDRLQILIASPGPGFDQTATETAVQAALDDAGAAATHPTATVVDSIPVGAAGKRPPGHSTPPHSATETG